MKLLGIDYGQRRIGVAITDESGRFVRPCTVIDRKKSPDALGALKTIIEQENPAKLVVGLPLDIDDNDTIMAKEIREFTRRLTGVIALPVEFVDESLTSRQAAVLLRSRKKKLRRNKASVDSFAACLILEAFLQEHTTCDGIL
jgi:putative Holliday junction resolvase